MQTVVPLIPPKSVGPQPLTVVQADVPDIPMEQQEQPSADTELFIRKTFDTNPQKGCELLYRLYYRPMCTHAVRFVYAKEIAEDLVADVFYSFWNTQAFQSVTQSYRAYLFRSVRNRAYNYLANELKKQDSLDLAVQQETPSSDLPESMMRFEELYHKVDELVAKLPPQARKVFIMNRFEGRKAKEIAEELHLSIRTVEVHIAKALTSLRNGLKDQWLLVLLFGGGSYWLTTAMTVLTTYFAIGFCR